MNYLQCPPTYIYKEDKSRQ